MTKSNPPPPRSNHPPKSVVAPGQLAYRDLVQRLTLNPMTLEDLERAAIEATLVANRFNVTVTARILGLGRTTLYRKMKQYHFQESARALKAV